MKKKEEGLMSDLQLLIQLPLYELLIKRINLLTDLFYSTKKEHIWHNRQNPLNSDHYQGYRKESALIPIEYSFWNNELKSPQPTKFTIRLL